MTLTYIMNVLFGHFFVFAQPSVFLCVFLFFWHQFYIEDTADVGVFQHIDRCL